jgi:eukaryotic-like serine/threonine-protein kinase
MLILQRTGFQGEVSVTEPQAVPGSGERIGPYRIARILARGGMGEVYLGRDDRLNRWVAIKRIRHDSDTPALRQRLLQEAYAVGGLHHPAIVLVYDLLEDEGDDCIVMEYVQGQTLAETLKAGPLAPALAVRLAKMVASGLAAAHEAGFIHRDLKTENVMVTPSGEAKILDFGLAKPIGIAGDDPSLTAAGHVVGTCRSMAPEQARGAEVDARSDLFSLGVLLYEMLTGISPFQGSNALETLNKVISERPPCADTLRPGLPPRLVALLYRLLDKEPAARPQSAAEVVQELHAIAASMGLSGDLDPEETVSALPTDTIRRWGGDPTPPTPPLQSAPVPLPESPPRPRRRRVEIAVILSLLLLLGGAILLHWLIRPRPLRIIVPNPETAKDDSELQFLASLVQNASQDSLISLGIHPIDQSQLTGSSKLPEEMARAAVADEILFIDVQRSGNSAQVTLRCTGKDGHVLWLEPPFPASLTSQAFQPIARRIDPLLRKRFSGQPQGLSVPIRVDVKEEDRHAFLAIQQQISRGKVPLEAALPKLEMIVKSSRHFRDAQLLTANVATSLFQSRHEERDYKRALNLIQNALKLASEDLGLLEGMFRLQMAASHLHEAADTLSALEDLRPGAPENLTLRADLADAEGQPGKALAYQQQAVDSLPTWQNLLKLAKLEARNGRVEDARGHLKKILEDSPNNIWAQQRLAELEMYFGDPEKAVETYRLLIRLSPERSSTFSYLANLGVAQVLLGRYDAAVEALSEALTINRNDVSATLNLADAELGLSQTDKAQSLYHTGLQQLERDYPAGDISYETTRAQFLAHLHRTQEAREIIENALRQSSNDPDVLQSAALVYTLADNQELALDMIKKALAKQVAPRWFCTPPYKPLFGYREFQQIVGGGCQADGSIFGKHDR